MPVISSQKYRKPRSGVDLGQFASEMRCRGQAALMIDLTRLDVDSLSFLGDFDFLTHLAITGLPSKYCLDCIPASVLYLCLLQSDADYTQLSGLKNLRVFDHRFGKAVSGDGLGQLIHLQALHLLNVEGLRSLRSIEAFQCLEWLKISKCRDLVEYPCFSGLSRLRRVVLEGQNGFEDLSLFAKAPALEDLVIMDAEHLSPSAFIPLATSDTPKRVLPGIGLISSAKFRIVCKILKSKVMEGYYGAPWEFFEVRFGDGDSFVVRLS